MSGKKKSRTRTKDRKPDWLPEHANERDTAILGAAYRVFVAKGFHRATMLDIATEARASKETLYLRFGSKERLFEALITWSAAVNRPSLESLANATSDHAEEALTEAGVRLLTFFYRPEVVAIDRMRIGEGALRPELGRIVEGITVNPIRAALRSFFGTLVREGVVPMEDAHAAAESYVDVLRGVLLERVMTGIEAPPDDKRIREIAARAARVAIRAFATKR